VKTAQSPAWHLAKPSSAHRVVQGRRERTASARRRAVHANPPERRPPRARELLPARFTVKVLRLLGENKLQQLAFSQFRALSPVTTGPPEPTAANTPGKWQRDRMQPSACRLQTAEAWAQTSLLTTQSAQISTRALQSSMPDGPVWERAAPGNQAAKHNQPFWIPRRELL